MDKRKRAAGFTLIEIMVVVVILGILAALIVPNIMDRPDMARVTRTKQDIRALQTALNLYRLDNYRYPTTDQGLEALVEPPTIEPLPPAYRKGGYLEHMPKDAWGRPYLYLSPGLHGEVDITSLGADGQPGGEGVNADIQSWNLD
ncbi:MAG TPA: type II secretion system major pseudopilin GspG [Candidatus Macondimonas sp.]|nr:type II secretion system major pseudopilin GspG [Candidatus Macondimonas sp.]HXF07806.1 type II secretion system major pseudopilin GspG [Candidatus Acidoferrales bacterium]